MFYQPNNNLLRTAQQAFYAGKEPFKNWLSSCLMANIYILNMLKYPICWHEYFKMNRHHKEICLPKFLTILLACV